MIVKEYEEYRTMTFPIASEHDYSVPVAAITFLR